MNQTKNEDVITPKVLTAIDALIELTCIAHMAGERDLADYSSLATQSIADRHISYLRRRDAKT